MLHSNIPRSVLFVCSVLLFPCLIACGSSGGSGTDSGADAVTVDTYSDTGYGNVDNGIPAGCLDGSGKVGAEGGCVAIMQGAGVGTRIAIPAGALAVETEISLVAAQTIAGSTKSLGSAVDFKPDGQEFALPVEIYLPRGSASDSSVYISTKSTTLNGMIGNAWVEVLTKGVQFKTKHFSTYEPVNPKTPIPVQFVGKWNQTSCVDTQTVETWVKSLTVDADGNEDIYIDTGEGDGLTGAAVIQFKDEGGGLFSYSTATSVPVYVEWTDADTAVFALGELFSDRIAGDTDPETTNNNIEEDRYCTYTRVSGNSAVGALEGRWEMVDCADPTIEYLRNSYWELGPGTGMNTDPEQKSDQVGYYYPNAAGTKFIADHLDVVTGYARLAGDSLTMSYYMPYMDLNDAVTDENGDHSCTYTLAE